MDNIRLSLPVFVVFGKDKKNNKRHHLNLNYYRNAYFRTLSAMKAEFHRVAVRIVRPQKKAIEALMRRGPVMITYTVYPFQKSDPANVACIVDKFFCDVLQKTRCVSNDDHEHIAEVRYRYGAVDREKPRCEVVISPGA